MGLLGPPRLELERVFGLHGTVETDRQNSTTGEGQAGEGSSRDRRLKAFATVHREG
jgi:hypothetical protein